jgi:type IV pilus assembly protein PilO
VILLGVLGLVVLVVAFYLLLLGPLLENLDQQAEARAQRQATLAELQAEVARLEEVQRNSPELQRQLLELNKRIPTQPEVETLVVQIEDIAEAAGVTQTQILRGDPGPPGGGGDFTVQPITMTFEGTYEELLEFLRLADDLVRLMAVNNVAYEVAEEGTTAAPDVEQNLVVEIDAEVYYQPTGVPEGTAPVAPASPETAPETAAPAAE